ncbi:UNVERIFIED_CONTAM: hypothetical protein Sradi_2697800 [Sesamum radiatum]|uniref:Uncharacterized protein n=1 Tax=Sesamum radiatum TaxID=300843 RepID=A0AAW2S6L1_SESRA
MAEIKYSSPSAGDLSSFSATAPRPVKIIQLQHPTTSTSSTPPPSSSFLGRWRGKMKRMTWVEWIELFLPCYRWIRTRWREYLQPDLIWHHRRRHARPTGLVQLLVDELSRAYSFFLLVIDNNFLMSKTSLCLTQS